ncbi:pentatricopeptide repeat-containing protein-like [Dorcoceras hygrometricum]|uniref:Pentatricopeptide repeat-containing protein-like n=1 Tax=Dorcoceras hygrometricum TaxID=472368 RepID=A0A2Z7CAF1_9LAMI|nr:pentatricopeptide repeat-containing protein-like [Dorcoceras hygrometricum]
MSCARWTVLEGVALVLCGNMQVGSDVREDGSAGATEPAGGGQIRPAAVIFAKGAAGPAGTLKDQAGPTGKTLHFCEIWIVESAALAFRDFQMSTLVNGTVAGDRWIERSDFVVLNAGDSSREEI